MRMPGNGCVDEFVADDAESSWVKHPHANICRKNMTAAKRSVIRKTEPNMAAFPLTIITLASRKNPNIDTVINMGTIKVNPK